MEMNRIKENLYKIAFYGSLVLLLAACAPAQVAPPTELVETPTVPLIEQEGIQQMPSSTPPTASTGMESLIEQAKDDLANRLSIPVAEISLVETKEVVWPDSSLGCPQPGMQYSQVTEDGAQILLQVQETIYDYHMAASRGLFLCENAAGTPYPLPASLPTQRAYP